MVKIVVGKEHFLHLVSSCCVQVNISRLKVLEKGSWNDWTLVFWCSNCRFEKLNEWKDGNTVIIALGLDGLGQDRICYFTIFLFGVLFGLFFGLFLFWLLFAWSAFLFGILFNRVLLFHFFSDGFSDIEKFDVFFELVILELISVMELKLQTSGSDFFLKLYRIHQPSQEYMFMLPNNLILPNRWMSSHSRAIKELVLDICG